MEQRARSQSVGQSVVMLGLVAVVICEAASVMIMDTSGNWLTTVVVASSPIEKNARVDPSRLHRRLRRADRSSVPLRLTDATGRFFTAAAAARCTPRCTELVLMRGDVSPRPEIDPGRQVWKAALADPWTLEDFIVGDSVDVAVSARSKVTPSVANRGGVTTETSRGAKVPVAGTPGNRGTEAEPIEAIVRMQVVAIAAKTSESLGAIFVSMLSEDAAKADQLQAGSLRVVSVVRPERAGAPPPKAAK